MGTKKSKREQQAELRRIYQNPLPIVFRTKDDSKSWWSYVCSLFTILPSVEVPVISGVYNAASNSVWVHDMQEARILWERGFFGKGSLSRSEPTWLTREVNSRRHEKSGRKGKPRSLVFCLDLGTHMVNRTDCRRGNGQASSAATRLQTPTRRSYRSCRSGSGKSVFSESWGSTYRDHGYPQRTNGWVESLLHRR